MAKTDFDIPLDISKIPKKELVRVKDDWSDLIIDKVAMKTGEAFLLKGLVNLPIPIKAILLFLIKKP